MNEKRLIMQKRVSDCEKVEMKHFYYAVGLLRDNYFFTLGNGLNFFCLYLFCWPVFYVDPYHAAVQDLSISTLCQTE